MESRWVIVLAAALMVLAACTSAEPVVEAAADDNPILVEPAPSTTMAPTTTTSTIPPTTLPGESTTTTTTLPPLPVPDPLPVNPHAAAEQIVLGEIRLPTIDVSWDLQQGMTLTAINRGPSQWPGTAMPGEIGNMVIAGHRTTYGAPFRHLDSLQVGDPIEFVVDGVKHVYHVTETIIVSPTDVWIADQTYDQTVTLFACHPVGSARQRIVVKGELHETIVPEAPTEAS